MAGIRVPCGPLRIRNFRLLLACNVISMTGSAAAIVAIPFAVLAAGGSPADVGYIAAAALVPALLFPLGGAVADRLPRHQVMTAANALQATAQAAAAALLLAGTARIWELAALAAARGAGGAFYFPAARGLLPQTVPAGQRAAATALDRISLNTSQTGGAALGGALAALAGPGWALAIDAATFAAAAAVRAGMRFPGPQPVPPAAILGDLREGWHDFISRRWLWASVLACGLIVPIITAATTVLGPLVAQARLGGARSWGIILAAYAAGAVLGAILMLSYRPRRILLAAMLTLPAAAVLLFTLAIPLPVPWIAAAALTAGGCLEVSVISWATTMQQEIPPAMLSRLSSYDLLATLALTPVATAAAGPAASTFGTPAVLAAGAIAIMLLTAATLLNPEVRNMQRHPPDRAGSPSRSPSATATPAVKRSVIRVPAARPVGLQRHYRDQ